VRRVLRGGVWLLFVWLGASPAAALVQEDLTREIQAQHAALGDLERLDELNAATSDLNLLRAWLAHAFQQNSDRDAEGARRTLDLCNVQAELVREKAQAARLKLRLEERRGTLRKAQDQLAQRRRELELALARKRALDGR